jgi:hypothetical protein
MAEVSIPEIEFEELIEGLSLGESISDIRATTKREQEVLSFICDLQYALKLKKTDLPLNKVFVGYDGGGLSMGDGEIFVDRRVNEEIILHEMTHAWFDSLNADRKRDMLDTYMGEVPDYLTDIFARRRVGSEPLVSFRKLWKIQEEYNIMIDNNIKHPLLKKISSLEEAVGMKPGTVIDHSYVDDRGKEWFYRFVKTNDGYRVDNPPEGDENAEELRAYYSDEKSSFLEVDRTLDEYLAYGVMGSGLGMPRAIWEAMERNGFDKERYRTVAVQVLDVIKQINERDPDFKKYRD